MSDPVARYRAQLDEDERVAKAATPGPWSPDDTGTVCADSDLRPDGTGGEILPEAGPMEVAECYRNENRGERGSNAEHIARHDPARALREVAAGRAVLAIWERENAHRHEHAEGEGRAWLMDEVIGALADEP